MMSWEFRGGTSVLKDPATSAGDLRDAGSILGLGRSPGNANGQSTPIFLPGESHEQRRLAGYTAWGRKELDTTD